MITTKKIFAPCALISAFVLVSGISSCDDRYDLDKEIDTTINIGKLAIPLGSTDTIWMKDILEVNDGDDFIQVDDRGNYKLSQEDKISTEFTLDAITVPAIIPEVITASINNFDVPDVPEITIPGYGNVGDIKVPVQFSVSFDEQTAFVSESTEVPAEVEKINRAYVRENPQSEGITAVFAVDITGVPEGVTQLVLSNFHVKFPELLIFSEQQDRMISEITQDETGKWDVAVNSHIIEINNSQATFELDLRIDGIQAPEIDQLHQISINDNLGVSGHVSVPEGAETTIDDLRNANVFVSSNLHIPAMEVYKISGKMNLETADFNQLIEFNDIPDFLKGDDIRLDLDDIALSLDLENPIGLPIDVDLRITPYQGETAAVERRVSTSLHAEGDATTRITLVPRGKEDEYREKYPNRKIQGVNNLDELLSQIPDKLELEVPQATAGSDDASQFVELGSGNKTVNIAYSVDVPFSFGPAFRIAYNDSIDGLKSDLSDITSYDISSLRLRGEAINTLPLDLQLNVEPYDDRGVRISEQELAVEIENDGKIPATDETEGAPLAITLKLNTESDALERLEQLKFEIIVTSEHGGTLNQNDFLLIKNIRAVIPDGITIDLDEISKE